MTRGVMIIGLWLIGSIALPTARAAALTEWDENAGMGIRLLGAGGVYFLAEPGELRVEVFKQERNRRNVRTDLRAIFVGPDRTVLGEKWLKDDGSDSACPGKPQSLRFAVTVPAKGLYGLNITVSQDRYGSEAWWGFRSNCPRYIVETSRGHRDQRHEEPIQVANAEREGSICFRPEPASFNIEISDLPPDSPPLTLFDGAGRVAATLQPDSGRRASAVIPADPSRGPEPWRLHLPGFQATVQIDGVTRWRTGDLTPDMALWTPEISSWFPLHENRLLLTPRRRTVHSETETPREIVFTVDNRSRRERDFALSLEYPDGRWPVGLSTDRVRVPAGGSAPVTVKAALPPAADRQSCRLRIEALDGSGFSTYSSIEFRRGASPARSPLSGPLDLQPYRHENEQLGYLPDYPLDNQVYFDSENRPYVAADNGLWVLRGAHWQLTPWEATINRNGQPVRLRGSKVAFDAANRVYVLGTLGRQAALIHSSDSGQTLTATPLPGSGQFDIEQFSGHNLPTEPPPLIRVIQTASDERLIWRRINDLDLFLPRWDGDSLVIGEPIRLSALCIGISQHSGIPSTLVSCGDKVHVTWGEATDPAEKIPGVPTYVATYDRRTATLCKPRLVGHGPPANDIHNTPCITIDSRGFLHVLIGTHGSTFRYSRSLLSNDASGGWTPAEEVGAGLRQTYVGLVCDPSDTLHIVFRIWQDGDGRFPSSHYAALARMSKRPGQSWSEPVPLVLAPFSEYSIFYHRLTIDRRSRLFLSYDYWSTFWFYRNDHRGSRRALMFSSDGANTWCLAADSEIFSGGGN